MQTKLPDGSVMVCGVLPKDAEYRTVGQNNSSLTMFSVKCGERKTENEDKPKAIWCNCKAWHDVARVAKSLKKGDCVFCVGRIDVYKSDDGKEYRNLVCEFIAPMAKQQIQTTVSNNSDSIPQDFEEITDDGVPF